MATQAAAMAASSSTSTDLLNFIVIYDTISATPSTAPPPYDSFLSPPPLPHPPPPPPPPPNPPRTSRGRARKSSSSSSSSSKKRRRKARVCKNKEEAETQRMTHIAVERNRRKLMNQHLSLLRSLMPPSYVQRGDQASIVAGAIEFVKELEHLLHSLQAQKKLHLTAAAFPEFFNHGTSSSPPSDETMNSTSSSSNSTSNYSNGDVADVEVTLIESHASLRILWRRKKAPSQLSRMVCGFHALGMAVLHFSLVTVHPFALYSVSAKVEEGCQLSSVEDIAAAVHHMLRLIIDQEENHHPSSLLLPMIA